MIKWRNRECRREDNYEKIELNHKVVNVNGGVNVNQELIVAGERRNGEYIVVPGADTDQEVDDEEESNVGVASTKKASKLFKDEFGVERQGWNSPENLLDPEDLHIPRRTIQETR